MKRHQCAPLHLHSSTNHLFVRYRYVRGAAEVGERRNTGLVSMMTLISALDAKAYILRTALHLVLEQWQEALQGHAQGNKTVFIVHTCLFAFSPNFTVE